MSEIKPLLVKFTASEHAKLLEASRRFGFPMAQLIRQGTFLHIEDVDEPARLRRVNRARGIVRSEWPNA